MADQEKAQVQVATAEARPQQVSIHLDKVLAELGKTVVQLRVTEEQYAGLQNQARQQVQALSTALQHANKSLLSLEQEKAAVEIELRDLLQTVGGEGSNSDRGRRLAELQNRYPFMDISSERQASEPTPIDRPRGEPAQTIDN